MKKLVALVLAAAMVACILTGCSKKKETFTIGFDATFEPFGFMKDGEYVGFDIDLAQEVCNRNGWELKKQPIDWDAKDFELTSGTIDCIWNGFTMTGREDDYTWSKPYVDNSQVFLVTKKSGISKLDDLKGKTVLVQKDSSALKALTDTKDNDKNLQLAATFKKLDQVGDYNSALLELESGAADAVGIDVGVAKSKIASTGDKFVMLDESFAKEQYGIGFKKGNTKLRDEVTKALDAMSEDGTIEKFAKKWDLADSVCYSK